jgi:hypothetical protein
MIQASSLSPLPLKASERALQHAIELHYQQQQQQQNDNNSVIRTAVSSPSSVNCAKHANEQQQQPQPILSLMHEIISSTNDAIRYVSLCNDKVVRMTAIIKRYNGIHGKWIMHVEDLQFLMELNQESAIHRKVPKRTRMTKMIIGDMRCVFTSPMWNIDYADVSKEMQQFEGTIGTSPYILHTDNNNNNTQDTYHVLIGKLGRGKQRKQRVSRRTMISSSSSSQQQQQHKRSKMNRSYVRVSRPTNEMIAFVETGVLIERDLCTSKIKTVYVFKNAPLRLKCKLI